MNPLLSVAIIAALYLGAGVAREVMVVRYYGAVSAKRHWSASGLAGVIELWDLIILAAIFKSGFSPALMLSYTVGVVIGTAWGTRTNR